MRDWQFLTKLLIAGVSSHFAICGTVAQAQPAKAEQLNEASEPADESSPAVKYPGLITHVIPVPATDAMLADDHRAHWAYFQPAAKSRGELLLYLPGTHGSGKAENAFNSFAAQMGYHVLSLSYRSAISLSAFRKSPDPDAFLKGRNNLIYGSEPIGAFQIDRSNSILNRFVKALTYLNKKYPTEGWGDYLSGDEPVWTKIVVAGLSQGGGHACLLGVQHRVARVLMFGAPKDNSLRFRRPADWLSAPKKTPLTCFFCFNHSLDEGHGCSYSEQVDNYKALGLLPQFPIVDVDNHTPPYGHTRLLTSHRPADLPKKNHGVVAGNSIYIDAWRYLLSEPCP